MNKFETTLRNGIKVITVNLPSEKVLLTANFHVGHLDETNENLGTCAVLENYLIRNQNTPNLIQAVYGGTITSYSCEIPKTEWNKALASIADLVQTGHFSPDLVELEKEDLIKHTRDRACLLDRQAKLMFKFTACHNNRISWDPENYVKCVSKITPQQLVDFKTKYYTSRNLVIVASGNINHEELVEKVEQFFDMMDFGEPRQPEKASLYTGGYGILPHFGKKDIMLFGFDISGIVHRPELHVLIQILNGRLERSFNDGEKCFDVDSHVGIVGYYGYRMLQIAISSHETDNAAVIEVVTRNIARLKNELASQRRLETSKNLVMANKIVLLTGDNLCIETAWQTFRSGHMYDTSAKISEIPLVTARDVQDMAQEIFSTPLTFVASTEIPCPGYEKIVSQY